MAGGGTDIPPLLFRLPLLVCLHKPQLCELQPQSAHSAQLFRLLSTHLFVTLPTDLPFFLLLLFSSPLWLWLSISNLAIFVALLWALINNCVCHRLLSLPNASLLSQVSGLRTVLTVPPDVVAAHQHLTMLQFYYQQTAKSAQTKYYYVFSVFLPSPLYPSLYFGATDSVFYLCFQLQLSRTAKGGTLSRAFSSSTISSCNRS